jgi:hypothetical protein
MLAAIPVSYPVDRPAVKHVVAKTFSVASTHSIAVNHTVASKTVKPAAPTAIAVKAVVKKPYVVQSSAHKPAPRKQVASVHTPGA